MHSWPRITITAAGLEQMAALALRELAELALHEEITVELGCIRQGRARRTSQARPIIGFVAGLDSSRSEKMGSISPDD
jgi:hypothetical protein